MAISKIALFTLATLAIISTLVAKLQNIVHITNYVDGDIKKDIYAEDLVPDARLRHLMWFLQISDLHLSIFQDSSRGFDLTTFCNNTVSVIRPSLVLATGDLIDARTPDHLGSRQYVAEWRLYQQILYETGVTVNTTWLDIRGNHDNFNVLSLDEKDNLYRKYSVQGRKHRRSYNFELNHDTETYNFIGVDACMNPGPKRPFNFLGVLQKEEYNHIKQLAETSANMTIWFGHYPTSTIVAPSPGARALMSGPYLCGHLHTLGGIVPEMYTLQSTGALELELADWKENRKYRLAAVDHNMFTFVDHYLGDWPLILITNPKNALYGMPAIEPLYRISRSTHIRVLIFSPYPIEVSQVRIDNNEWMELISVESPLFVTPWEPLEYLEGLHEIVVYAKDKNGNEQTSTHKFSLDYSRPAFPLGARLALMGHISVGQAIFGSVLLFILLPLCGMRLYLCFGKGDMIKAKSELNCWRRCMFKLWLTAHVDVVFWPLVIGALYVAIGPWFVGYIIDDHIGICFVWGIFLGGTFLPGGLTFFAGAAYLLTFYIPLVLCLSHCLYHHYRNIMEGGAPACSFFAFACRHFVMLMFIAWELICAVGYFYSYGTMAFLLGFTHTWSVLLALVLWWFAITVPESKLSNVGQNGMRQVIGTPLLPNARESKQMTSAPSEGGISPS